MGDDAFTPDMRVGPALGADMTGALGYAYHPGGLNNQKLALFGLFLDACKTAPKRLILPDMLIFDQTRPEKRTVPLGEVFSLARLGAFAARHGITMLDSPTKGDGDCFNYFETGAIYIGHTQDTRGIGPDDFACDFFRHLVPYMNSASIFDRLAGQIFDACGVGVVAQFRIEKDWQDFVRANFSDGRWDGDFLAPFETILAKISETLPEESRAILVTCDEAGLLADKELIRSAARQQFGTALFWKSDFLTVDEMRTMTPLDLSLLDFELAVRAPIFVGMTRSSFSTLATFETFARTGADVTRHYIYDLPGPRLGRRTDNGALPYPKLATARRKRVVAAVAAVAGENVLAEGDAFADISDWQQFGHAETALTALAGPVANARVARHRLRCTNDYGSFLAFGRPVACPVSPGDCFTLSAFVLVPDGFRGTEVTMCLVGYSGLEVHRAVLGNTGAWQRIWFSAAVTEDRLALFPVLAFIGCEGDAVYSSAWKLEIGRRATGYEAVG